MTTSKLTTILHNIYADHTDGCDPDDCWSTEIIEAYIAERENAAQLNGVRWTIKTIDKYHMLDATLNDHDRLYKGIKNSLRDEYQAEMGVDPAPSYPVNVELKSNERVSND